jgi:glutathione synthase/RimK-type ligase-like ATP-grasp enzyme
MGGAGGRERILLTGGRAPVALELARLFDRAGHAVYSAESFRPNLLRGSRAVRRHYTLPSPRFAPAAFRRALLAIIAREGITLVVPTCEEIYAVARLRDAVPPGCRVFADRFETLAALHSKWTFVKKARAHGLRVPATRLVDDPGDVAGLLPGAARLVLKPVYSRFGEGAIVHDRGARAVPRLAGPPRRAWLAQEFIAGRQLCTFSVAVAGRLVAHCAYPSEYRWGIGSTIYFRPIEHAAAFTWVERFVAREGFTGQIAFDFIEDQAGEPYAIECNPRATSGVHLFGGTGALVRAYTGEATALITPAPGRNPMVALAMLLRAPGEFRAPGRSRAWLAAFAQGRDVALDRRDPLPFAMQFVAMAAFALRARRLGITPTAATTYDIEYNGEDGP